MESNVTGPKHNAYSYRAVRSVSSMPFVNQGIQAAVTEISLIIQSRITRSRFPQMRYLACTIDRMHNVLERVT